MKHYNKLFLAVFLFPLAGFSQQKEPWIEKPHSEWPQIAPKGASRFSNRKSSGDLYPLKPRYAPVKAGENAN